jgi:hypothetical protein
MFKIFKHTQLLLNIKNMKKIFTKIILLTVIIIIIQEIQDRYESIRSTNQAIESSCNVFTNEINEKYKIDEKLYPYFLPSIYNKSIDLKCLNLKSQNIKTILLWNNFKGLPFVSIDYGIKKPFEQIKCPVTNCELTNNRSRFNESSFVLFHLRNKIDYFPKESRPKNQRWIHIAYESSVNCHLCDKYKDVFNLTASYKKESDFSSLFWLDSGLYRDLNPKYSIGNFSNKTKLIGTLISHCNDPIGRMN